MAEFIKKDICTGLFIAPSGERIYIVSLYMPRTENNRPVPLTEMITSEMINLLRQVRKEKAKVIILSDTNCWSQALWNMDRTDSRGEILESFILNNRLVVQMA